MAKGAGPKPETNTKGEGKMIDVTVRVEGRGTDNDFACDSEVKYFNVKNPEMFNVILRVVAEALFSLEKFRKNEEKK